MIRIKNISFEGKVKIYTLGFDETNHDKIIKLPESLFIECLRRSVLQKNVNKLKNQCYGN